MSVHQYCPYKSKPTVHPADPFDPKEDADALRKAMKGFGCDKKAITDVLTKRSIVQRLEIAEVFKTNFGKDLVDELKSELSGDLENLMVALMTPLANYYAKELHDAMARVGTDEDTLVEVLCTIRNTGIKLIDAAYKDLYGKTLESDLEGDTSGQFKRLLVSIIQGNRDENQVVDRAQAIADAEALFSYGDNKSDDDQPSFRMIFVKRSCQQLRQTFIEYERIADHKIEDGIKKRFSGEFEKGLLAIVKRVRSKTGFFAERLYASMKGIGTNDRALIRVIVGRSEIDLGDIKQAFLENYGKSLESWIIDETSGDYQQALISLVSE